jgi:hypothetical protein
MWRVLGCIGTGFAVSGLYFLALLYCFGKEENSAVTTLDQWILLLIKLPFLFVMPFLDYQIFGIDSLNFLVVSNSIFWGVMGMILFVKITRKM